MQSVTISKTPAVQATPDYSIGDVIGGVMTLSGAVAFPGDGGVIEHAAAYVAIDASLLPLAVLVFNANPTASTTTENGTFALHANDAAKLVGVLDLDQVADLGTPVILYTASAHVPFTVPAGKDLYAVAIASGTMNLGSTSDLTFVFGIRRDRDQ